MRWLPQRRIDHQSHTLARLLGLAAALDLAAGIGMVYVVGFTPVGGWLPRMRWWYLGPALGGFGLAFVGYTLACRGILSARAGTVLDRSTTLAVVTAGFGGFLAQGGGVLYEYAMRAGGATERAAKVHSTALAGFEQGALALLACPAATVALLAAVAFPRSDFTWPWALIPLPGLLIAAGLSRRYRGRLRDRSGLRRRIGIGLDALHLLLFEVFGRPVKCRLAIAGMLVFWAGDMLGLWACTAMFGYRMSALAAIVGLASAMVVTRRMAPLGGAGFLTLALTPTLWYGSGVPLAVAVLGVLTYRLLTMWIPVVPGLITLPALRALAEEVERSPAKRGGAMAGRQPRQTAA